MIPCGIWQNLILARPSYQCLSCIFCFLKAERPKYVKYFSLPSKVMRLGLESFVDRSRHSSLVPSTCTCTYIFYIEHVVDVNATQVVFLAPKFKKK